MVLNHYFSLVILLLISAGITGNLAVISYIRQKNRESKVFSLLLLTITVYCFGYALELKSDTLAEILLWSNFQYLGIVFITPLWLILALLYNGLERWLIPKNLFFLFLIPILTLIAKYANPFHLFYRHLAINHQAPFPVFNPQFGPWYWVHIIYQNITLLMGMLFFLLMGRRTNPLYHRQVTIILIGFLFPWIGSLIYHIGLSPWNLDLTPFTLTITTIFAFWGFSAFRLFDIVPIAWTKVFESLHDGVLVLDMQNRIIETNAAAKRMLKLENNFTGLEISEVLMSFPQLCKQVAEHIELIVIQTKTANSNQYFESRLYPISDSSNRITGYTIILTDKSEQIRLFNELQILATIDSLTEVKNRRYFFETCRQELTRLQSQTLPVSFILIDIDHFKIINDTYGHQSGDMVLSQTVKRLKHNLAVEHIFGRVGGEEFAIMLPECLTNQAFIVAKQLLKSLLSAPVNAGNHSLWITASFGVSGSANSADTNLDLLFAQADTALYCSKANGRKRVTVFDPLSQGTALLLKR
jgi:diguanylate cyclase (GGDEF)-like protein